MKLASNSESKRKQLSTIVMLPEQESDQKAKRSESKAGARQRLLEFQQS